MANFVLVPGACHGGWWFQPLVDELSRSGHRGTAVTLSGLGEGDQPAHVNLESHIEEVIAVCEAIGGDVVLVGHSYGGSVISGAADRIAARVPAAVYLDAFVPNDGDSCYAMTNDEQRQWYIDGAGETGHAVAPLPFFDARARPHPLGTLIQRSRLTGAWESVAVKHYVAALDWPGESPFAPTVARIRASPGWHLHEWQTRHNVMHDGPQRVLDLLLAVAEQIGSP